MTSNWLKKLVDASLIPDILTIHLHDDSWHIDCPSPWCCDAFSVSIASSRFHHKLASSSLVSDQQPGTGECNFWIVGRISTSSLMVRCFCPYINFWLSRQTWRLIQVWQPNHFVDAVAICCLYARNDWWRDRICAGKVKIRSASTKWFGCQTWIRRQVCRESQKFMWRQWHLTIREDVEIRSTIQRLHSPEITFNMSGIIMEMDSQYVRNEWCVD